MNTVSYLQRKNYAKYDESHFILYLNEEVSEVVTNEETGGTEVGYAYSGTLEDGGTMIEATGVTDENRRARFIAGLIGTKYDIDAQIAILANGDTDYKTAEEMAVFEAFRKQAKADVDELLAREL